MCLGSHAGAQGLRSARWVALPAAIPAAACRRCLPLPQSCSCTACLTSPPPVCASVHPQALYMPILGASRHWPASFAPPRARRETLLNIAASAPPPLAPPPPRRLRP